MYDIKITRLSTFILYFIRVSFLFAILYKNEIKVYRLGLGNV